MNNPYIQRVTDIVAGSALDYRGTIDCSGSPNYPAADAGDTYIVSVSGKIGGASGTVVAAGDMLICNTDETPAGTQAAVGAYWNILEKNVDFSNVTITGGTITGITDLAIADGGTGASTAQAAINALSAVSAATNEYVLTKDTATGNAIFKANVGGIPVAAAAGTVDAITADYTPDVTLADQKMVAVVAAGANTSTTPTFAPDGLTAHTIVKNGGQALAAGDISGAGHVIILEYNLANTRWELLNPKVNIDLTAPGPIGGTTPSTGAFTGLTLSDAGKITLDIAPASDHTATGIQFSATAGEALAYGNVCCLKSDGKYWKIDADAAATMPATVMALATIAEDTAGNFLDYGWARDDSWSWIIGGMVYASTDSGGLTQTAPSGEADNIQIVGKAETATVLKFAPSWITAEVGLDVVNLGTATSTTITFAEMTAVPKTWMADHSSDQTITFAAPTAADVGKRFTILKNGTGAGKLIVDAPSGVYLHSAAASSGDGGTAYLAASARGSMTWFVASATEIQLLNADGTVTFT